MDDDTFPPFELPAVARKKVTAAFDGGRLSSDGGVLLLRDVERRLGFAERLAECIMDRSFLRHRRAVSRVPHPTRPANSSRKKQPADRAAHRATIDRVRAQNRSLLGAKRLAS